MIMMIVIFIMIMVTILITKALGIKLIRDFDNDNGSCGNKRI